MQLIEIHEGSVVVEVPEYECHLMVKAFHLAREQVIDAPEYRDNLGTLYGALAMFWEAAQVAVEYTKISLTEYRKKGVSYEASALRRAADKIQPDHAMQRLHERLTDLFGEVIAHEIFSDVLGYDPIEGDESDEADEADAESAGGDE